MDGDVERSWFLQLSKVTFYLYFRHLYLLLVIVSFEKLLSYSYAISPNLYTKIEAEAYFQCYLNLSINLSIICFTSVKVRHKTRTSIGQSCVTGWHTGEIFF